jgi:hypothetical protein
MAGEMLQHDAVQKLKLDAVFSANSGKSAYPTLHLETPLLKIVAMCQQC